MLPRSPSPALQMGPIQRQAMTAMKSAAIAKKSQQPQRPKQPKSKPQQSKQPKRKPPPLPQAAPSSDTEGSEESELANILSALRSPAKSPVIKTQNIGGVLGTLGSGSSGSLSSVSVARPFVAPMLLLAEGGILSSYATPPPVTGPGTTSPKRPQKKVKANKARKLPTPVTCLMTSSPPPPPFSPAKDDAAESGNIWNSRGPTAATNSDSLLGLNLSAAESVVVSPLKTKASPKKHVYGKSGRP